MLLLIASPSKCDIQNPLGGSIQSPKLKGHIVNTQTRLDKLQRELLDMMKEDNSKVEIFHFPSVGCGVCVAIKQTGIDTAKFAVSLSSPEENTYRYDVAEYVVLNRWENMEVLPCFVGAIMGPENRRNVLGRRAYDIAVALAK